MGVSFKATLCSLSHAHIVAVYTHTHAHSPLTDCSINIRQCLAYCVDSFYQMNPLVMWECFLIPVWVSVRWVLHLICSAKRIILTFFFPVFSLVCLCACTLCSHVHSWQNIITRTIWSCCICWIGWANHFHRGFDKSFRMQSGAEPVSVGPGRHRWWTRKGGRRMTRLLIHRTAWCETTRTSCSLPPSRQADSNFTCKGSSSWNKDHSILNFSVFGNFVLT